MTGRLGEDFWKDDEKIVIREDYKILSNKAICSSHRDKDEKDCCQEAVREAAKKNSSKNEKV